MKPWWRPLDPRRHLAAAVGWCVFLLVGAAALLAAAGASAEAAARVRADQQRLLAQQAAQVGQALAMQLQTRLSVMQASAAQIVAGGHRDGDAVRRHLAALQAQFPEFTALVLTDLDGSVVAATGTLLPRGLRAAPRGPFMGEPPAGAQGLGTVDATVPVLQGPAGPVLGVLHAQLSWPWVDSLRLRLAHALDAEYPPEVLLQAADGRIIAGGGAWLGRAADDAALTEGGRYVLGRLSPHAANASSLAWAVVVRQDAAAALAPAQAAQRAVFLGVLLAGMVAAAAAVLATQLVLRRLQQLAADVQALRSGARETLAAPPGADEVARIGGALADAVARLQQEKAALAALNAELDARVAERTARIEHLAEESRLAAVTRERLRLARELHDTLAHSLMALLTQIRLVRKLRRTLDDAELDEELARAEAVATSGLADARAAITQMRHNSVRDAGLGAALRELLARFGERTGLATQLDADERAAGLADERGETLFRIVEEALNNVERHAQARSVVLTLGWDDHHDGTARVRLDIADDGQGFDPAAPRGGHFGLRGIEEQAALIGANFHLDSAPGAGTRLHFDLPA
jgi:signal transduction histidine kinase